MMHRQKASGAYLGTAIPSFGGRIAALDELNDTRHPHRIKCVTVTAECAWHFIPACISREPLHNSGEAMAADRPSPADHRPQGVMQRLPKRITLKIEFGFE